MNHPSLQGLLYRIKFFINKQTIILDQMAINSKCLLTQKDSRNPHCEHNQRIKWLNRKFDNKKAYPY